MLTRTGSAHAARTPTDAIGPVTDAARTVTSRNAPMPRSTTAPRSTGASTVHRTAAALVALAMMLLGLGTTLPARADGGHATPASTPAPTSIGDCLGSGRVWLFVSYQDAVVSNQCVGNPSSGTEALGIGGVSVRKGKGGTHLFAGRHARRLHHRQPRLLDLLPCHRRHRMGQLRLLAARCRFLPADRRVHRGLVLHPRCRL